MLVERRQNLAQTNRGSNYKKERLEDINHDINTINLNEYC